MSWSTRFKPHWLTVALIAGLGRLWVGHSFGQENQTKFGSLLQESSLSTGHVLRDLASQDKSTKSVVELARTNGRDPVVVSRSGKGTSFQFRRQPSSDFKAANDAVAEKLAAKTAQEREAAQNPFWNAPFWTKFPVAILGSLLGGDKHRLETPPTERERVSLSDYAYDAAIQKYERTLRFDQPAWRGQVLVGKLAP